MFALTPRLALRPGWPEDAPALARAIGHEAVTRNLSSVPWPYTDGDAAAFLAKPHEPGDVFMLITDRLAPGVPVIGGIGLHRDGDGYMLGYWLTPSAWGRGYATEAGRAILSIARDALRLPRLRAGHFADNPASGRVLAKLGFRPTGHVVSMPCPTRGTLVPTVMVELEDAASEGPMPLAA